MMRLWLGALVSMTLVAAFLSGSVRADSALVSQDEGYDPDKVSIYFQQGRSELTGEAGALLDATAENVKERGAQRLVIVGYGDDTTADDANEDVAAARAMRVERGLVARGIDPAMIKVAAGASAVTGMSEPEMATIAMRRADVMIEQSATGF